MASNIEKIVIDMVENNSGSENAMILCEHLYENGGFDFLAEVDGYPFVFQLMLNTGKWFNLSDKFAELLDSTTDGAVWQRKDRHGRRLIDIYASIQLSDASERCDKTLSKLVERSRAFFDKVEDRNSNKTDILSLAIDNNFSETVSVLCAHGRSLLEKKDGKPIATKIKSTKIWKQFLSQGGDPGISCGEREDGKTPKPLWQHIRDSSSRTDPDLVEIAAKWGSEHDSEKFAAMNDAEYWARLERAYNIQDISSAMKADPSWFKKKRQSDGANAMMVCVTRSPKAFSIFKDIKKAQPHFSDTDSQGRNLWYYFAKHGRHCSTGTGAWLSKNVTPIADKQGRGLVLQLLENFKKKGYQNETLFERSDERTEKFVGTNPSVKKFLWDGTKEQFDEASTTLTKKRYVGAEKESPDSFSRGLAQLVDASISELVESNATPRFLGALVLNHMLCHESNSDSVEKMLSAGAIIDTPTEPQEKGYDVFGAAKHRSRNETTFSSIMSRLESNKLSSSLSKNGDRKTKNVM